MYYYKIFLLLKKQLINILRYIYNKHTIFSLFIYDLGLCKIYFLTKQNKILT